MRAFQTFSRLQQLMNMITAGGPPNEYLFHERSPMKQPQCPRRRLFESAEVLATDSRLMTYLAAGVWHVSLAFRPHADYVGQARAEPLRTATMAAGAATKARTPHRTARIG